MTIWDMGHGAWGMGQRGGVQWLSHGPRPTAQAIGFSLVELVISLSILLVGIVGSMRVFPVGLRASKRSELNSRATITAQRTIESVKLTAWDELIEGETVTQQEEFAVTTRVTIPSVEPLVDPTRLKAVEVIVQWQQDGRARDVIFVTYLRRES